MELPYQVHDTLEQFRDGEVEVQFRHKGLDQLTSQADVVANRLVIAIVMAATIVGSSLIGISADGGWHLFGIHVLALAGVRGRSRPGVRAGARRSCAQAGSDAECQKASRRALNGCAEELRLVGRSREDRLLGVEPLDEHRADRRERRAGEVARGRARPRPTRRGRPAPGGRRPRAGRAGSPPPTASARSSTSARRAEPAGRASGAPAARSPMRAGSRRGTPPPRAPGPRRSGGRSGR